VRKNEVIDKDQVWSQRSRELASDRGLGVPDRKEKDMSPPSGTISPVSEVRTPEFTYRELVEHRKARLLDLVRQEPGITIKAIAQAMELEDHGYLYRVMPKLVREGLIHRVGEGWFALPLEVTPALVEALMAEGLVQREGDGWRAVVPIPGR